MKATFSGLHLSVCGQHATGDLGAKTFCVLRRDNAARHIAVEVFQLLTIDAQVISGGRIGLQARPAKGHEQNARHRNGKRDCDNPEQRL